jgi:hypothetical protein
MALNPGEYRSGGNVVDGEGRRVLAIAGGAGLSSGEYRSGSRVFDSDGREVVTASGVAGGSGAVTAFKPESYGALRDGSTDDTAAIKACVAACVSAGIANGTYCGVVQFTAGVYMLSGALTQGGATKGNALIPIPVMPDTGKKFILVLKGFEEQALQWHWNQTVFQDAGVVLRATVTGTDHATYGRASVIGGPTPQQGYGGATNVWSNMMIVVDGVQVMVPDNPAICGFDFRGIAEMNVPNASCLTRATTGAHTAPTNGWQFGIATPENNNNANSKMQKFVAMGCSSGAIINEHCTVDHFTAIYCLAGMEFAGSGLSSGHGIQVGHICVEACDVGVGVNDGVNDAAFPVKVTIRTLDFEFITFAVVNDPLNRFLGRIENVSGIGSTELLTDAPGGSSSTGVRGAVTASVYDRARFKGVQASSPAIPASGTPMRNPYFRDGSFRVTGGTVSNVQVTDSGQPAQSVATATNTGWIPIATGGYVTLTYTVVPTSWQWMIV